MNTVGKTLVAIVLSSPLMTLAAEPPPPQSHAHFTQQS